MDMHDSWQGFKQVMMFLLGGLIVLFAVVNSEAVTVNLLFGEVDLSLSLLIIVTAIAGMVFGWLGTAWRGRRKRKELEAEYEAELAAATAEEENWLAKEQASEGAPQSRH